MRALRRGFGRRGFMQAGIVLFGLGWQTLAEMKALRVSTRRAGAFVIATASSAEKRELAASAT